MRSPFIYVTTATAFQECVRSVCPPDLDSLHGTIPTMNDANVSTVHEDEGAEIRGWIAANEKCYRLHVSGRDVSQAQFASRRLPKSPQAAGEPKAVGEVAGLTVSDTTNLQGGGLPPQLLSTVSMPKWLGDLNVVIRVPDHSAITLEHGSDSNSVITLKHDSHFTHRKLKSARTSLPAGFSWTYKGDRLVSCAYPGAGASWSAAEDVVWYDEEGTAVRRTWDVPWTPLNLRLYFYGQQTDRAVSSELTATAGSSGVGQDSK